MSVLYKLSPMVLSFIRDVTAATWGGSSVPSSDEEEGGESTASLPGGAGGLDDTREDLEHTYTSVLGTCMMIS